MLSATGCDPAEPISEGPAPSIEPPGDASPAPATTYDSSADGLDSGDLLRMDGIGAVVIGMKVSEAEAATGLDFRVPKDFGPSCRYAFADDGPEDVAYMTSHGRIVRIDVFDHSRVATELGIKIRDDEDDVFFLYGDKVTREPHPYLGEDGSYLIYDPADGSGLLLIFETDKRGKITSFRAGRADNVRYIEGCA